MELIATGKWSKADKRWKMVVALRRAGDAASGSTVTKSERNKRSRQRPQKRSDT